MSTLLRQILQSEEARLIPERGQRVKFMAAGVIYEVVKAEGNDLIRLKEIDGPGRMMTDGNSLRFTFVKVE
jgi:hypothetical protein